MAFKKNDKNAFRCYFVYIQFSQFVLYFLLPKSLVLTTAFAWYSKYGEDTVSAFSYIDKISFADDILRIDTTWRRGSALLQYFEDSGLKDHEGYYYHDCSERDIAGTTNVLGLV